MHSIAAPPPLPGPVTGPAPERQSLPDLWRGVALIGIFLVNITGMKSPLPQEEGTVLLHPDPLSIALEWVIGVGLSGKFVSMFAFLFGLGMGIQIRRASAAGQTYFAFGIRRFSFLLALGILHALLLWPGDILTNYAVAGLTALALHQCQPRTLRILALLFALATPLAGAGAVALLHLREFMPGEPVSPNGRELTMLWIESYQTADLTGRVANHAAEWFAYWLIGMFGFFPLLFALFLWGLSLGKSHPLPDPALWMQQRRHWLPWTTLAGILCGFGYFYLIGQWKGSLVERMAGAGLYYFSMPLLAFSWAGLFAHWHTRKILPRLRLCLQAAGRLSLTHYLMQSTMAAFLFMNWGLNQYGQWSMARGFFAALGVGCLQAWVSPWWLARFHCGPAEWLWRSFSYQKLLPFRKPAVPGAEALHGTP